MRPQDIVAHILKAIWYCREKGIQFKYSDYFTNMPKTGTYGFGGYTAVKAYVNVRGQTMYVTIIVPLLPENQFFRALPYREEEKVDPQCGIPDYKCSKSQFIFGSTSSSINVTEIWAEGRFFSTLYDFFTGTFSGPAGPDGPGGRDPRSGDGRNVVNNGPSKPIEDVTTSPTTAANIINSIKQITKWVYNEI